MDKEWIEIITYFRVQRNLRMAASDFVAPLLTGEKKDGGPPGLLGKSNLIKKSKHYHHHPKTVQGVTYQQRRSMQRG